MSGEEEFSLDIKLMCFDRYKTEDAMRDQGMSWREAHVDEEEFAEAWRPPTSPRCSTRSSPSGSPL